MAGYDKTAWANRVKRRPDLALYLTHLTRENGSDSPVQVLLKIVTAKCLRASTEAYTYGGGAVVCFQDAPLSGIYQNLLSEEEMRDAKKEAGVKEPKYRYSGTGLRLLKEDVFKAGGRPVIYEKPKTAQAFLPKDERWRIVGLDLEADPPKDWTHEREWRVLGDLSFDPARCEIVVGTPSDYRELVERAPELLNHVQGIHVLSSSSN